MRYKFLIEFDQTLTGMPNIPNGQQGNEKEKKTFRNTNILQTRRAFVVKYKAFFIVFFKFILVKYIKVMETTNLNQIK